MFLDANVLLPFYTLPKNPFANASWSAAFILIVALQLPANCHCDQVALCRRCEMAKDQLSPRASPP
jgi:hypothetical protein